MFDELTTCKPEKLQEHAAMDSGSTVCFFVQALFSPVLEIMRTVLKSAAIRK